MTTSTVTVCTPERVGDLLRCGCCGYESDQAEQFSTSLCWPCSFGFNPECGACLDAGVLASFFHSAGKTSAKAHYLKDSTTTRCGRNMPSERATGGSDLPVCSTCQRAQARHSAGG